MLRRHFLKRADGNASVEFALGAPVLLLALIGIFEISMLLFTNAVVEGAVRTASRFGLTGQQVGGLSREQVILQRVQEDSLGLVEITTEDIDILVYPSFTDVGQPEPYQDDNGNGTYDAGESYSDINGNGSWDPDMGASGAGGPGDVVVYRVRYAWPMMTGYLAEHFGDAVDMAASIAVKNEPFEEAGGG
jgi:Flp pilus assembly protein TadG